MQGTTVLTADSMRPPMPADLAPTRKPLARRLKVAQDLLGGDLRDWPTWFRRARHCDEATNFGQILLPRPLAHHRTCAIEVKAGHWKALDYVKEQVRKDLALRADSTSPIQGRRVALVPRTNGTFGPSDELRELLMANNICHVIHVP